MTKIALPIETERLVIRPLRLEDADDLLQPADWISEKIERFERDDGMSLWAVVDRSSRRAVALAGLQWEQIDGRRELDLGCAVARDARRLGYATEAARAVLGAAFAAGSSRITAMTGPDNGPALRVLAKLGFTAVGETSFEGRPYALFVLEPPSASARDTREGPHASAADAAPPAARSARRSTPAAGPAGRARRSRSA